MVIQMCSLMCQIEWLAYCHSAKAEAARARIAFVERVEHKDGARETVAGEENSCCCNRGRDSKGSH